MKQALVQQIIVTVKEAYLADIHQQHRGRRTCALTRQLRPVDAAQDPGTGGHCQEDDLQPARPHCNRVLRSQVTSQVSDITGTLYTQFQESNIVYVIIHRTGKFGMAIRNWNCMTEIQKTCVRFKHFFLTSQQELRKTKQDQVQTETLTVVQAPVDHVANAVKNT